MKRHILVSDQERPLIWIDHAHPYEPDDAGWVSVEDFKAFVGFIIAIGLFIPICAVESPR